MSTKSAAVLGPQTLPDLPFIDVESSIRLTSSAVKRIQSDADVVSWQKSKAHQTLILFLARLCESAIGKGTRTWHKREDGEPKSTYKSRIELVLELLDDLQTWTSDIEPFKSPQRFGNLAFRLWGQRLEEKVTHLHQVLLPIELHPYIAELECYLLGGFGSWTRLDYGSGHELSFLAWLCFLTRLGTFSQAESEVDVEERLALEVIPKYLEVVWGLQDRYGLEPAGSHGVWGLDDYQFIPYAIGAAQLRSQASYLPSAVTSVSHKPDHKLSIDELLRFIPSPSRTSNTSSQPPFANLYTTSIARIHSLKRGPFAEHSPILYDVATTVPNWIKVHSGMMKMWEAECLGKRPVVQHFPFGGLAFVWEGEVRNVDQEETRMGQTQLQVRAMPPTAAPWKNTSTAMPSTAAPWKTNLPTTRAPWSGPVPFDTLNMASTGSAAAASSPFGIISRPSVPSRSRIE